MYVKNVDMWFDITYKGEIDITMKEMYGEIRRVHERKMELSKQRRVLFEQKKWEEVRKLSEEIRKVINERNAFCEKIRKKEEEMGVS